MSSPLRIQCAPYGDNAVLVSTTGGEPDERWNVVQALACAASATAPDCVLDTIAAYDTLLVQIRTEAGAHAEVTRWVRHTKEALSLAAAPAGRIIRVPVVYGGDHGPDLETVATELGLSPDELIAAHSGTQWTIRMLGSPVGAPMMDGGRLPSPVARCKEPRTAVSPGSVALAGQQCVIYPVRSPGGWRLIGRTPLRLTDVGRTPPTQHRPGDLVRFTPIDAARWQALDGTPLEVP